MLGGGIFSNIDKKLPGTYMNFVSIAKAIAATSERGVVAMALKLDWGPDNEIFKITAEEFANNTLKVLGYNYSDEKLKGLRDLFFNATTLYAYRLNSGEKATCTYGTAKYSGIRGNDIRIVIQKNVDDESKFDVTTILGTKEIETQIVSNATELIDNDYIIFNKEATLEATAGVIMTGGTNSETTGENHQDFLNKLESYTFNAVGCTSKDKTVSSLYAAFVKRMREDIGMKCQAIIFNNSSDYEGIINVVNTTTEDETGLIYWVTGIIGGCAINQSNTNRTYNGEYTVAVDYTQSDLEKAIDNGKFILHKVGDEVRILKDVNSLVTLGVEKGEDFKSNQTIRVLDQVATDVANIFNNKYLGKIQNNEAGRVSLWGDIVSLFEEYQKMQAIEDFKSDDVEIKQGEDKISIIIYSNVKPISAIEKLYMSVIVE